MKCVLSTVQDLQQTDIEEMTKLLHTHFESCNKERTKSDLADKTHVIRIYDSNGLCGLSTFAYEHCSYHSQQIAVIYSGDTIVDPRAWRSTALFEAWIRAVRDVHTNDSLPLYWLLICSGPRTFRLMQQLWKTSVPRPGYTNAHLNHLRNHLARHRYGSNFDGTVVRFQQPQALKAHLQDIPKHIHADASVELFCTLNPSFHHGDELVCCCSLAPENVSSVGQRLEKRSQKLVWSTA